MIRSVLMSAVLTIAGVSASAAQQKPLSPPAETSVTINGKTLTIKYSAPSVRGRKMFGPDGRISKDPNYPVWRAGANAATAFHTDADLDIGGVQVLKGDYTLYVLVEPEPWQLIINKQTGQWGLTYDPKQDLGRVKMIMSKPSQPIETFKISLTSTGTNTGQLQMEFENYIASVPFTEVAIGRRLIIK